MRIEELIDRYLIEAADPNKKRKQAIRSKIEDLRDEMLEYQPEGPDEKPDEYIKKNRARIREQIKKLKDQLKAIK
jgi:hypothetical protein